MVVPMPMLVERTHRFGLPDEDNGPNDVAREYRSELTHGLNANIAVWEGDHPFWRGETDLQAVLSTLLAK
jgi:hypothetical protein